MLQDDKIRRLDKLLTPMLSTHRYVLDKYSRYIYPSVPPTMHPIYNITPPVQPQWHSGTGNPASKCPLYVSSKYPLCSAAPWERVGGVIKVRTLITLGPPSQSPPPYQITYSKPPHTDLDPIPLHSRKWSVGALIAYWFSDAFNAATWEFAASIIAIGLSYRDAVGIVACAFFIVSVVISLNGATGVLYHAPFPVLARAGWGFWGSYGKFSRAGRWGFDVRY